MKIVYEVHRRYADDILPWEVVKVENGHVEYTQARFIEQKDAEVFRDHLEKDVE